jgi:hypothetical protein
MVDEVVRRFAELMDSTSTTEVAAICVVVWAAYFVLIVVHELGHAIVALLRTDGLVLVTVGRSPGACRLRLGRLAVSLDPRLTGGGDLEGWAAVVAKMSRSERVALSLAGPAANLAVALLLVPAVVVTDGPVRFALAAIVVLSLVTAVWNLLSSDPESDGRQALAALRDDVETETDGELSDALGRWMALYTRGRDPRFSGQRALLFENAVHELGVDQSRDPEEAKRYWRAAFAGWCWREVQPADQSALAGAPQRAWRAKARDGLVGLELAGSAAVELARVDGDNTLEEAFLATTELVGPASTDERSRFAFRYGVAVHDVERVMSDRDQRYW